MSKRTISAIVFAIIVFIEVILFVNQREITKMVDNGNKGFFHYDFVLDKEAQQDRNLKYITIIGATILVGGIVTFSLDNNKR